MIYVLEDFELDLAKVELRRGAEIIPVEPQVFSLLALIIENHERMVSRDEIVERIWDGRVVSEAAISTRVKAARRALGDDGETQRVIRTVHGRGYRCIAGVRIVADAVPAAPASETGTPAPTKPSIAVLPFRLIGDPGDLRGDLRRDPPRHHHRAVTAPLAEGHRARVGVPIPRRRSGRARGRAGRSTCATA